jgi:hypothetical protein
LGLQGALDRLCGDGDPVRALQRVAGEVLLEHPDPFRVPGMSDAEHAAYARGLIDGPSLGGPEALKVRLADARANASAPVLCYLTTPPPLAANKIQALAFKINVGLVVVVCGGVGSVTRAVGVRSDSWWSKGTVVLAHTSVRVPVFLH